MSRCLAHDTIFSLGGEGLYRRGIRAAKEEGVEGGELGVRKFYQIHLHESFASGGFWLRRDLVCPGQALLELRPSLIVLLPLKEKKRCCVFTKINFRVLSVAVFVRYKKNSKYPQPLKNPEC